MPPIPAVRPNKPLESGQTTIFSRLNGAISVQRGHVYMRLTNIGPWAYNPFIPLRIRKDLGLCEGGGLYQGGDMRQLIR